MPIILPKTLVTWPYYMYARDNGPGLRDLGIRAGAETSSLSNNGHVEWMPRFRKLRLSFSWRAVFLDAHGYRWRDAGVFELCSGGILLFLRD